MAETSSDFGTLRSRMIRPTGTIMAPPIPCTRRAATRSGRLLASEQRIEPSVNRMMAPLKTRRVPKRSAMMPLAGMNTARLRRYEVSAMLIWSG